MIRDVADDRRVEVCPLDRVKIAGLRMEALIGVHDHERAHPQPIVVTIELDCERDRKLEGIGSVVCYETIVDRVRAIADGGHVELVESFADQVAAICLDDRRVVGARVSVEKPNAIPSVASVGVEIQRFRSTGSP